MISGDLTRKAGIGTIQRIGTSIRFCISLCVWRFLQGFTVLIKLFNLIYFLYHFIKQYARILYFRSKIIISEISPNKYSNLCTICYCLFPLSPKDKRTMIMINKCMQIWFFYKMLNLRWYKTKILHSKKYYQP